MRVTLDDPRRAATGSGHPASRSRLAAGDLETAPAGMQAPQSSSRRRGRADRAPPGQDKPSTGSGLVIHRNADPKQRSVEVVPAVAHESCQSRPVRYRATADSVEFRLERFGTPVGSLLRASGPETPREKLPTLPSRAG